MIYIKIKIWIIFFFIVLTFILFLKFSEDRITYMINVNEVGIEGNGKDITQDLQNLLNSVNTSKIKEIYFPEGTYTISFPIKIDKPITLKGNNAVFKLSDRFKSNKYGQGFFYSESIDGITFKNLIFNGNNKSLQKNLKNNFVLFMKNSSYINVINCEVYNLNGHGRNLNSAFSFVGNSNHILVKENRITNSNGGAIFFQGAYSMAIDNNAYNLKDVAYVTNGIGSKNVIFKNNKAISVSSGSIGIENGASKITIEDNYIENFTNGYGIGVLKLKDESESLSKDIVINNNEINVNKGTNPSNGIAIVQGKNIIVYDNIVKGVDQANQYNNSIYLGPKTENVLVYNNVLSNSDAALFVNNSKGNNITIYDNILGNN